MADILVQINQAQNLTESIANLETVTQSLGWVETDKSLNYIEDIGGPEGSPGVPYQVSSTVGPGQGRRVTKSGHGFNAGQPVRLQSSGGMASWILAQHTVDGSKNATHIVTRSIDESHFDVSNIGAWSLSSLMNAGAYYLSETPGQMTTTAPSSSAQVIGICDGMSIYLTLSAGASAADRMTFKSDYDAMKIYVAQDVVTYQGGLYVATALISAGSLPGVSPSWRLLSTKVAVPTSAALLASDADNNVVEGMILDENDSSYPLFNLGPGIKAFKIAVRVKMTPPTDVFEDVSDVVTSGTLDLNFKVQSARAFFAGPASGNSAVPTFRLIAPTDLGTGTPGSTNYLRGDGAWAAIVAGEVGGLAAIATSGSASDLIAGTVPATRMPSLTGDVTMAVGTTLTAIASTVVTGKVLTGYVVGTNSPIAATDSILQAFQKVQGQIAARQDTSVSQAANQVYAAPNGSAGVPSFRLLVPQDIPALDTSKVTTGIFDTARIPALVGDVTSTAGTTTTSIASTIVTGKVLTGYAAGANSPIAATDSILQAFQKIQGQVNARQDSSQSQAANTVYAAPNGSAGAPAFRLLVAQDIPVLDTAKITTGTMSTARLGSGTASSSVFLKGDSTWAAITASNVGGLAAIATSGSASDLIAGTVPGERMPALTGDATMAAGTTVTAIASIVVTSKVLTGYVAGANSAIAETDSILQAFQKLQGQVNARTDSSVSRAANLVYASPNGSAGVPSFRSLVQADIPSLDGSKIGSGTVAAAYLGSGVPTSSTFLRGNNTWSVLNATDIPGLDWSKIVSGKPTTLAGYGISSSDALFDSKYILVSSYNVANGTPQLDASGKIPASLLPGAALGALQYQGAWNASANSPALPTAASSKGYYYVVSVAGTYNTVQYDVKDWIVSNGTTWDKIDNTDLVTSVFGRLGDVTAQASDYSAFYPLLSGSYSNPSWIAALDGSKITTGTVAAARLGSGSPTALNFLRGDGTWTAITASSVGGLAAIATSGSANDLTSGTVPTARMPALTGDVTMSAGTTATSLANIIAAGGPVGSSSVTPVITWDSKGRLTAVSSTTITPAAIGAPTTTGTGASGTWGINITGNAATATNATTAGTANNVTWANVSSKPAGMDNVGAHRLYRSEDSSQYWAEIGWTVGSWAGNGWFMSAKNSQGDSQTNIFTVRVDFANNANNANYATSSGSTTGNAATATKLATARTIAATGDASWSVLFDGSSNVSAGLTLAASGVTAGTYRSVTVNSKGLVTAGTNPTTLAGYGVSSTDTMFDTKYGLIAGNNAWTGTNTFSQNVSIIEGRTLRLENYDGTHFGTFKVGMSGFVQPGNQPSSYDDTERLLVGYDNIVAYEVSDDGIHMRNKDIVDVGDLTFFRTLRGSDGFYGAKIELGEFSSWNTHGDISSCRIWNESYTSYFGKKWEYGTQATNAGLPDQINWAGMSVNGVNSTYICSPAESGNVTLRVGSGSWATLSQTSFHSSETIFAENGINCSQLGSAGGHLNITAWGKVNINSPDALTFSCANLATVSAGGGVTLSTGGNILLSSGKSVQINGSVSDNLTLAKGSFANSHDNIACLISNQRTVISTQELVIRAPIVFDATVLTDSINYLPPAGSVKIGTTLAYIGDSNGAPISIYLYAASGDYMRYRTSTGATSYAMDNSMSIDQRFVLAVCVSDTTWQCIWY